MFSYCHNSFVIFKVEGFMDIGFEVSIYKEKEWVLEVQGKNWKYNCVISECFPNLPTFPFCFLKASEFLYHEFFPEMSVILWTPHLQMGFHSLETCEPQRKYSQDSIMTLLEADVIEAFLI
jgi:hypothetical protein